MKRLLILPFVIVFIRCADKFDQMNYTSSIIHHQGQAVLFLNQDTVLNIQGEALGHFEVNTLINFSGQPLAYIENEKIFNMSGQHLGNIADDFLMDTQGNKIIRAEGGSLEDKLKLGAAFFFFL